MDNIYDRNIFHGFLLKGDLKAAMTYISHFPEQQELYRKYISLFQDENYLAYGVDADLNEILLIYQKYYRDVFYLSQNEKDAAMQMHSRFARLFPSNASIPLDDMEKGPIAEAFRNKGYHFLHGKTSGYYGPYIWKTEELKHYTVELPDGTQEYTVKFLDDFLSKSWIDYLSFGDTGTGGWSNGDGLIHCVKSSYDLESETFQVSLLKHEAQHAADLVRFKNMSIDDLEYRAKLVELIYSTKRNMLLRFMAQAYQVREGNGHALAANRIVKGFKIHLPQFCSSLEELTIDEVQNIARQLFEKSNEDIIRKYS